MTPLWRENYSPRQVSVAIFTACPIGSLCSSASVMILSSRRQTQHDQAIGCLRLQQPSALQRRLHLHVGAQKVPVFAFSTLMRNAGKENATHPSSIASRGRSSWFPLSSY